MCILERAEKTRNRTVSAGLLLPSLFLSLERVCDSLKWLFFQKTGCGSAKSNVENLVFRLPLLSPFTIFEEDRIRFGIKNI